MNRLFDYAAVTRANGTMYVQKGAMPAAVRLDYRKGSERGRYLEFREYERFLMKMEDLGPFSDRTHPTTIPIRYAS